MSSVLRIAKKELAGFFSSPAAFIFFAAFLAITLFVFFWVETFFARNIADVRPLFEWMPVLLIFLVAAMTMRMWSEERRAGTLEFLLTVPVNTLQFVLGKFLACMGLVTIALLLTLPVPISVSFLGSVDWGPIFGGYLATLFLAAAYIAIGLYVSAKNDNQIVSLIITVVICGVFYLLGSDTLTNLFGNRVGEYLGLLGSGSRFSSITRGVIDLRDLYYYLSIVAIFISLNVFSLERIRWASSPKRRGHHQRWRTMTTLFIANFIVANLWLYQLNWARADLTEGNLYSISDATRNYIAQLKEPMLIRGYFSAQTHPLLSPLVPQVRNLIEEYEIASDGKIRVEFIDPLENPELEQEAAQKFGIKPVPFQTASKYQASIVNSYFDVLIQYGDQYEVLSFRDLIEVKAKQDMDVDVALRNPEYDITRSIKKVLYGYQGTGELFENIKSPVTFRGFFSANEQLPDTLVELRSKIQESLDSLKTDAGDKLSVEIQDPSANGGALAKQLEEEYGFRPMAASLFATNQFWFYMTLESAGEIVQIPLPEDLSGDGFTRSLEAGLKRFSSGFLKTIAMHSPAPVPHYGGPAGGGNNKGYETLRAQLNENYTVKPTDLTAGKVPEQADLLLVASPQELDQKQVYAIDQFLMMGGTVIVSSGAFDVEMGGAGLTGKANESGLSEWLSHHGITMEKQMVLDPINTPFPIPTQRNIGGFSVQEIQSVAYPYFVDIREDGMNTASGMMGGIPQITMNWSSPITVDEASNEGRTVTKLLESSADSWTSDNTNIQPDFNMYGPLGFPSSEQRGKQLLAVAVEGQFQSFFKDKPSPLIEEEAAAEETAVEQDDDAPVIVKNEAAEDDKPEVISSLIDKSPDSARIILFASNSFLTDQALGLASSATRTRYLNSVQLIENAADWSLEDRGLLSIRSRGHFSRMLKPLDQQGQLFWEYLNYGLAILGLLVVYIAYRQTRKSTQSRYQEIINMGGA